MNPLTGLFGAGVALRNTLFERGILRSRKLSKPVISVGNLSVGGSGKTPFVIALGGLLAQRGIRCDVLSRGYGRKTHGALVVEASGTAAEFGDEPLLIARRLNVPVIVGESRYAAGRLAEEKFDSQIHLLDDGFQHRSLYRDFDIVLLTSGDLNDQLLPKGRLREPLSALQRADAIVLPQDASVEHPALTGKIVWGIQRHLTLSAVPPSPVAFCGIARPKQFFEQLRSLGVTPVAQVKFADHHPYTPSDVAYLRTVRGDQGAGGFITTEKDAVNLGSLAADLEPVAVAMLQVTLDNPADVVGTMLARIAERKPRS